MIILATTMVVRGDSTPAAGGGQVGQGPVYHGRSSVIVGPGAINPRVNKRPGQEEW